MTDESRPQDQGRRHRRAGRPSAATRLLLTRYMDALRAELGAIIDELEATEPAGLGLTAPTLRIPLHDARRDRLIDRSVTLARQLGSEIDPMPEPSSTPTSSSKPGGARRVRKGDM